MTEVYSAINDLRTMFPNVEAEVVQAVYEGSQRNLDAAVAALIEISDPQAADQERARNPRSANVVPVDAISGSALGNSAFITSTPADQLAADEIFARSLQDEMFVRHLQQREDFARQLDEDARRASPGTNVQEQSFKEKLANMSDATKKKFREMYSIFRKRDGSSSNLYTTLPHDEEEMTVLRNNRDEDEDAPLERRGRF